MFIQKYTQLIFQLNFVYVSSRNTPYTNIYQVLCVCLSRISPNSFIYLIFLHLIGSCQVLGPGESMCVCIQNSTPPLFPYFLSFSAWNWVTLCAATEGKVCVCVYLELHPLYVFTYSSACNWLTSGTGDEGKLYVCLS